MKTKINQEIFVLFSNKKYKVGRGVGHESTLVISKPRRTVMTRYGAAWATQQDTDSTNSRERWYISSIPALGRKR